MYDDVVAGFASDYSFTTTDPAQASEVWAQAIDRGYEVELTTIDKPIRYYRVARVGYLARRGIKREVTR